MSKIDLPASLMEVTEIPGERYRDDAAGMRGEEPLAVYAPRNATECAALLVELNMRRQPCVVQGGRTGLAGGARIRPGEAVLSTERMRDPPVVDEASGTMRLGAAITLEEARSAAEDHGWMLAADLGARGSATIGGLIATNAGGPLAIRYGTFRNQVLGLEAVLADGTIIDRMNALWKDNTGYNLPQMILGSEGTLAVVTAAVLRLHPQIVVQSAALCACSSMESALALLPVLKKRLGPMLQACEFMTAPLLEMSAAHRGTTFPFEERASVHLLVEAASAIEIDLQAHLEATLAQCLEDGLIVDALISQSEQDRMNFWRLREGCNEALDRNCAPVVSLDLSLPVASIPEFLDKADRLGNPDVVAHAFGHLGDGNIHYILSGSRRQDAVEPLFALAAGMGGVISAEHGIGQDKSRYLHLCRSPAEIEAYRRLKAVFDPNGILNPGRIIPDASD